LNSTKIIAEAGVNHNGEIDIAFRLIDTAKASGADIVKFQTFQANLLATRNAPKAIYQNLSTPINESQYDMLKSLELNQEHHLKLISHCNQQEIEFMSTPFDIESIAFLDELGLGRFKIPSGDITNYPYLKAMAGLNKDVIMSTGMSNLIEIEQAIETLVNFGTEREKITLLHCNTEYPTPFEDVNLAAMSTMRKAYSLPVGYSDHTRGIEVSIAAVALGATVIEKHFTMDRTLPGPDHKASLEPHELKAMCEAIRNIEISLGTGEKIASKSEFKNIDIARKSIVAKCPINKGDTFTEANLTTKRPGSGISPMLWIEIIGQVAKHNFITDDLIDV
jgi:N,N'-diacetyllegionaminate synthase